VLATRVPNISEYWLLQIALLGLKENIRNELELLDIKDNKQARQNAKIVGKKLKVYQNTT
jgi:hypothetical protein